MKSIIVLSTSLALVCAIASAILTTAEKLTREKRDQAALAETNKALRDVLPEFDNSPMAEQIVIETEPGQLVFFPARRGQKLVGIAGQGISGQGYGGELTLLVGLTPDGHIRKIMVTRHSETPGLGSVVTDRRETQSIWTLLNRSALVDDSTASVPPCPWLDQYEKFNVLEHPQFKVDKDGGDLDALSGATITSRAVADAVNRVAETFKKHHKEIIK